MTTYIQNKLLETVAPIELTENIFILLDDDSVISGAFINWKSSPELFNWIYNNVDTYELDILQRINFKTDEGTRQLAKEITDTILEAVEAENLMK